MHVLKGVRLSLFGPPLAHSLVQQLLERDVHRRVGCKGNGEGFQEFQRLPWFHSIDWETIESKEQIPPFTPDVGHSLQKNSTLESHSSLDQKGKL